MCLFRQITIHKPDKTETCISPSVWPAASAAPAAGRRHSAAHPSSTKPGSKYLRSTERPPFHPSKTHPQKVFGPGKGTHSVKTDRLVDDLPNRENRDALRNTGPADQATTCKVPLFSLTLCATVKIEGRKNDVFFLLVFL